MVRANALRVTFPGSVPIQAVRDVDLALFPGKILGLVGESGSGKTAVARALAGLHGPSVRVDGTITLRGAPLPCDGADTAWTPVRGARIGFVFQDAMAMLNPIRRIGESLDATLALDGSSRKERCSKARDLLSRLGFEVPDRILRSYPHELSGGMRQRVGLALALARDPDLLIADEPTTALDVLVQADVVELIRAETRRRGLACLFVSHDLGLVAGLCDRVSVMYAGRIVESGPAADVFARPAHRYTAALLSAMPELDGPVRLGQGIPGEPVSASAADDGCAFAPRCDAALSSCHSAIPALAHIGGGARVSACLNPPARQASQAPIRPELRVVGEILFRLEGVGHVFRGSRPAPWKARPELRALDGINLDLRRGECLALVGQSGSGKSTLARILTGAIQPSEGVVTFRACPVPALGSRDHLAFSRKVQIVLQSPHESFDRRLPIGVQIAEPLVIHGIGDREARRKRVLRIASEVAFGPDLLERMPADLSGGQLQRASIARALVLDPDVLICDEPVSALDLSLQGQIVSLLAEQQRARGLTILFVTHDLSVARQIGQRIAVLRHGHLLEVIPATTIYAAASHAYTRALGAAIPGRGRTTAGVASAMEVSP